MSGCGATQQSRVFFQKHTCFLGYILSSLLWRFEMLTTLDLPLTGENEVGFSLLQNELTQEQPNYFALFETEASSFMDTDLGTIAMRSSNETDVDQAANRDSEIGITNDSRQLAIAGPSKIKRASRKTKNQKQYTEFRRPS